MDVVAHQAIGDYLNTALLRVPYHQFEIEAPISVVEEDVQLTIASAPDVKGPARRRVTECACHRQNSVSVARFFSQNGAWCHLAPFFLGPIFSRHAD